MSVSWGEAIVKYETVKRERDDYRRQLMSIDAFGHTLKATTRCPCCKEEYKIAVPIPQIEGDLS